MNVTAANTIYTPEAYIQLEEAGEIRHEYINGNLIEMSERQENTIKCVKRF